jgi:hypothetical protein
VSIERDQALVKASPHALARTDPRDAILEARRRIDRARARVSADLDALEETLAPARRVREAVRDAVRRHPVLTLGGALVMGYGLARLFFRR